MITKQQWMEMVEFRITEGSSFMWNCFGPNAYCLDSWDGDQDGCSLSITFDTKTQVVYKVEAHDYRSNSAYRLLNPVFANVYAEESKYRSVAENQAWDDVNYIDLEVDEDFLEKGKAIFNNEPYSKLITLPLNLNDDELFGLMKMAHEKNITFNELVIEILQEVIDKESNDTISC